MTDLTGSGDADFPPLPPGGATGRRRRTAEEQELAEEQLARSSALEGEGGEEEEEERAVGHVEWRVYSSYIKAVGWFMVVLVVASLLLMQVGGDVHCTE